MNTGYETLEVCLLICMMWRDMGTVCPPSTASNLLSRADREDRELSVSKRYIGMLHEVANSNQEAVLQGAPLVDSEGNFGPPRGCSQWFSQYELHPAAPANLARLLPPGVMGDLFRNNLPEELRRAETECLYSVPRSTDLAQMNHITLVVKADGNLEVASTFAEGVAVQTDGDSPPPSYRFKDFLKVLTYGSINDYVSKAPCKLACVLDI